MSSGSNPTANTRTSHYNESGFALTSLAIIVSGWYTDATNETNAPDTFTVTGSVEYPAGTFTQIKWSGTATGTIAPGLNVISDLTSVAIPKNAQFWIRLYAVAGGTGKLPLSGALDTANGELGWAGASLVDMTMGGAIPGTLGLIRPSAIISNVPGMRRISLAALGNSIVCGSGDATFDNRGNVSGHGRAATGRCPYIPMAVGSTRMSNQVLTGKMDKRLNLMRLAGITHALVNWAVNDLNAGFTLGTMQADLQNFWRQVNAIGVRIIHTTSTSITTSTDNWQTTANQTLSGANFLGGASSVRQQLNDYMRSLPAPLDYCLEIADAVDSSPGSGLWGAGAAFNSRLAPIDNLIVASGSTTTNVRSDATRADGWYNAGGAIVFTSGALAGTRKTVSGYLQANGAFTVTALGSAPSAGDTFTAYPLGSSGTADGTHPQRTGLGYGAGGILEDQTAALINALNIA